MTVSNIVRGWASLAAGLAGLLAASSAQADFSPSGQFYAGPGTGASIVVADYRGWPAAAPVLKTISVAKPLTYADFRKWRVDDEGFLWIADGMTLTRYSGDPAVAPQTRTIKLSLSAGARLELTTMSQGKMLALVYVVVRPGKDVQDLRCKLDPQIFAEDGLARYCKITSVLDIAKDVSADYVTVDVFGYTDYRISAGFTYHSVVSRGPVTNDHKIRAQVLDGEVIFQDAKTLEEGTHPAFEWQFVDITGQYYSQGSASRLYRRNGPYGSDTPIELTGTGAVMSYDGKYAFTRPAGKASSYLVRDLSKPAGTEREVLMPNTSDIVLSPSGRFFQAGYLQLAYPMDYLLDPYFGKSKEVVTDVIMARILRSLELGQWPEALQAMGDLEARNSALPEDF
ncbi:MAG: hypothetical protein ABW360_15850, partial [Phenylobacterium sp.]